MSDNWYVLRTEPMAEYLAAAALDRDGFDVFLPCVKSIDSRKGHDDTPIFPGYLFLRVDTGHSEWPTFRMAHRISGWVNFGGVIPSVPGEVVSELRQRMDSINGSSSQWRRFHRGEKVRVLTKSMDSLAEVLVEAKSPQGWAKVLMEFMGQMVTAQVPWSNLQPAAEQPKQNHWRERRTRGKGRWIKGHSSQTVAVGLA